MNPVREWLASYFRLWRVALHSQYPFVRFWARMRMLRLHACAALLAVIVFEGALRVAILVQSLVSR